MKRKLTFLIVLIIAMVSNLLSCKEDATTLSPTKVYLDLPETPYQYMGGSSDLATLGRVLFYDTRLSVNNAISCGTCHKQGLAFSDNVSFSRGFENRLTLRNSLPIQNLGGGIFTFGLPPSLFWDGREKFLQSMVLKPIVNHVEMGMNNMSDIAQRVRSIPYYPELFNKAFGSTEITSTLIASALAAFTGSIMSNNTRFDRAQSHQASLNGLEAQGKDLFFNKYNCNSCHQSQMLNGYEQGGGFINIGLDMNYSDNGLGALNHNPADNGKFKIPNLRNITLTAPYMHDGRFTTLNQVLDHYSHNIQNHPNLDSRLKDSNNQAMKMNISNQEKTAIIAFLGTLTDYTMITDPKFSNPFKTK